MTISGFLGYALDLRTVTGQTDT